MDRQRAFDCLKALGYSDTHVQALIEAEVEKREKAKEETFKKQTEDVLRSMEL